MVVDTPTARVDASDAVTAARKELACVVAAELAKCAKCGQCASVCPIYAENNLESYCARGKLILARSLAEQALAATPELREIVDNCLVCLACVKNCGSAVRLDKVVMAARRLLVLEQGQPFVKALALRAMLPYPRLMNAAMKGGRLMQPLAFATPPETSGLRRRFPIPGIAGDQPIPPIAPLSFMERTPEYTAPTEGPENGQVSYFCGCAANYLLPPIGEAVMYVLGRFGKGVFVPRGQGCCGAPAAVNGETEVMRKLVRRNLDILCRDERTVISSCGSGGLMLGHGYAEFLGPEDPRRETALGVGKRVRDISEYLVNEIGLEAIAAKVVRKIDGCVTYHDPCHLARGVGVSKEPRSILSLTTARFKEMPEADRCCGSGGTYGVTHWETSRAILERKIGNAQKVHANVIATGCPACIMQLSGGSDNLNAGIVVCHTVELLAWAMGFSSGPAASCLHPSG